MFFIGIFGLNYKENRIRTVEFKCTGCLSEEAEFIELYQSFEFFFIPVFKFKKSYLLKCKKCNSLYKVKNSSIDKILKNNRVDYEDIEEIIREA